MTLDLNKIKSLVEYNLTSNNFGNPPGDLPPGFTITKQQVWTMNDVKIPFTTRQMRDMIAQCLYDILTDATSDGTSLSQPLPVGGDPNVYYSGGNKTAGTGIIKLQKDNSIIQADTTDARLQNGTTIVKADGTDARLEKGNTYIKADGTHVYAGDGVTEVDLLGLLGEDYLSHQIFS